MRRLLLLLPAAGLRRNRSRRATLRLHSARERFDRSMARLRKAALDHIDSQMLVGLALRTALERFEAARP
ncbi:hypothetical protein [Methylobacterium iners]|uniref:Uncharacterized protein n=1 Tax=Methylobacterium iners TaxID=418707 RepID=A0ABQ4RYR1_9HYPH|nr:hypothetical protein [Methylobacterium iners]GJD95731.1 hypothetical protein OCOJLMKI_2945 [Methylobacterium iners]